MNAHAKHPWVASNKMFEGQEAGQGMTRSKAQIKLVEPDAFLIFLLFLLPSTFTWTLVGVIVFVWRGCAYPFRWVYWYVSGTVPHAPDSRVMFIYIFNGICTSLMDLEVTLDLSGSVKYWCWFGWSTGNLFLIAKTNLSPFLGTPGAERNKEIRGDHVGKKAIIRKLHKSYASATRTWLCSPTLPARKVNDARALWWQQCFSDEKWGWFSGTTVPPVPESPISQCLSSVHTAPLPARETRGVREVRLGCSTEDVRTAPHSAELWPSNPDYIFVLDAVRSFHQKLSQCLLLWFHRCYIHCFPVLRIAHYNGPTGHVRVWVIQRLQYLTFQCRMDGNSGWNRSIDISTYLPISIHPTWSVLVWIRQKFL